MKFSKLIFPLLIILVLTFSIVMSITGSRASLASEQEYKDETIGKLSYFNYLPRIKITKVDILVGTEFELSLYFNPNDIKTYSSSKNTLGLRTEIINYEKNYEVILVNNSLESVLIEDLENEIRSYLDEDIENFGLYILDLKREKKLLINAREEFPPASISKLPSVILSLKEIQEGKITFEDTLPVKGNLKHSNADSIGRYENGTLLPINFFIDMAILESNNTAHYHLHDYLGGAGIVNERTNTELNASVFFLDPHIATAESVGNVLEGIYKNTILDEEYSNYLLNLMKNTVTDLRLAIPGGVPQGIEVANKVGFLYGGKEGSTYSDAAIVFGEKTDYVLVVLNKRAPVYPYGYEKIREISEIVYTFLN